ncbi:hypothetical protein LG3211_3174 [Lysobacter gummosus]|nr:hypothetical protein LG3211_3174 [Lysobacter gummosus]
MYAWRARARGDADPRIRLGQLSANLRRGGAIARLLVLPILDQPQWAVLDSSSGNRIQDKLGGKREFQKIGAAGFDGAGAWKMACSARTAWPWRWATTARPTAARCTVIRGREGTSRQRHTRAALTARRRIGGRALPARPSRRKFRCPASGRSRVARKGSSAGT